jgi:hypothetical protein
MKVLPGTAFPQATQSPTAADFKASKGAAQQFAASLRAAGLSEAPNKRDPVQQVLQPSSADKPRPNLPRGSLIDIRV